MVAMIPFINLTFDREIKSFGTLQMDKVYRSLLKSNKYIPVWELESGATYRLICRNSFTGIWMESVDGFVISREEYNTIYPFLEYHLAINEEPGTAKPFEYIEHSPFNEADLIDILSSQEITQKNNKTYHGPMEFHDYLNIEEDEITLYKLSKYQ